MNNINQNVVWGSEKEWVIYDSFNNSNIKVPYVVVDREYIERLESENKSLKEELDKILTNNFKPCSEVSFLPKE